MEKYHCGFDPNSLDMLVFRELGIAIFDSTEPHEHFPSREGDTVIDMYERCVTPGTDEKYADRIFSLRTEYKKEMKAAIAQLAEAKRQHDELKDIYVSAVDFSIVNRKKYWIEEQLEALTAQS